MNLVCVCVCDSLIFNGCRILVHKSKRCSMLERIHVSHMGVESCLRKARDILFNGRKGRTILKIIYHNAKYAMN